MIGRFCPPVLRVVVRPAARLLLALALFAAPCSSEELRTHWRSDPLFQRLASALDRIGAIDNHTHLLRPGAFNPLLDSGMPLLIRSTHPWLPAVLRDRFGVTVQPGNWDAALQALAKARDGMTARLGEHGYWMDHLDYTRTDIALVNDNSREGTDGQRLRWVPHASTLLYPLPADHLKSRSPSHEKDIAKLQADLRRFLGEAGRAEVPGDLAGYERFVDETLVRWQKEGAVAVKFWDAYLRTLRIADVPQAEAAVLYAKGRSRPLARDEYLALQDFLWRHILLKAGERKLPVHIHSSLGVPPFLRTLESDVRNLEDVLADPRFFATPVVLIHGGGPFHEHAAYLALKPNVWVDISAMGFLYPVPDFAVVLRKHLTFAPGKLLFGTDAAAYPGVPGADVHHIMTSRATRDALYVALAGLIADGVVDETRAVEMGRAVLRGNAERLYGWK
jgi:predicted TIM-barrel fold metal-dependent hydrolase